MKVTRLNHAAVNVEGHWKQTERFYCQLLGLGTTPRPGQMDRAIGGCWLQLPNAQVHLIDAPCDGSPGSPVGPHISYYVDDLAEAEREIEANGLEATRLTIDGLRIIWITDPAGNTVELQQDPEVG